MDRSFRSPIAMVLPIILSGCATMGANVTVDGGPGDGLAPVNEAKPEYPRLAAHADLEGCVTVAFDVGRGGRTDNFQVIDSRPKSGFDHAVLLALRDWRFESRSEPVRLARRFRFARGADYDANSPSCLNPAEVPADLLEPGEPEPETGKPTLVTRGRFELPKMAVRRGIERGCVTLAFDVLTDGTTANHQILDSEPPGVFDKAALDEARERRYSQRASVTRIADRIDTFMARAGEPPSKPEIPCLAADEVPDSYLRPGPEQPEPMEAW